MYVLEKSGINQQYGALWAELINYLG